MNVRCTKKKTMKKSALSFLQFIVMLKKKNDDAKRKHPKVKFILERKKNIATSKAKKYIYIPV